MPGEISLDPGIYLFTDWNGITSARNSPAQAVAVISPLATGVMTSAGTTTLASDQLPS